MYFLDNANISCKNKQQVKLLLELLEIKGCTWTNGADLKSILTDEVIDEEINRSGNFCLNISGDVVIKVPHPWSSTIIIGYEHLIKVLCQNSASNKINDLANEIDIRSRYTTYRLVQDEHKWGYEWRWF